MFPIAWHHPAPCALAIETLSLPVGEHWLRRWPQVSLVDLTLRWLVFWETWTKWFQYRLHLLQSKTSRAKSPGEALHRAWLIYVHFASPFPDVMSSNVSVNDDTFIKSPVAIPVCVHIVGRWVWDERIVLPRHSKRQEPRQGNSISYKQSEHPFSTTAQNPFNCSSLFFL